MDADAAEFIGIFIGDGSLHIREEKYCYEFKFTGNKKDEIPYFEQHVSKLASKILDRDIRAKILDGGRSIGIRFCSKSFAGYLKTFGINGGPKSATIFIPYGILAEEKLLVPCLRGIFDTDGCFTRKKGGKYPVITFGMKSRKLISQLRGAIFRLGIRCCVSFDVSYYDERTGKTYAKHFLSINGRENVAKWFSIVGSSNQKNRVKYEQYLKEERISRK